MTIRYTCPGCQSVLKIRDEKAGTDARCPKCKRGFAVPEPDSDDGIEVEEAAINPSDSDAPAADLSIDLPVDMPIELTPEVTNPEPFDAGNFLTSPQLNSTTRSSAASPAPAASPSGRKPSVAELMKDFETSKKSKDRDKGRKSVDAPRPATSSAETTGSAADALARAYQQKRDTASAPPPLTKDDARAAEQRAAVTAFLKSRFLPGLAAAIVLGYAWYWYINREIYEGPPLYEVTGTVTQNGKPAAGVIVEFGPADPDPNQEVLAANGITDEQGRFRLRAFDSQFGAPAGPYTVGLINSAGIPISLPEEVIRQTVTADGINEFNFSF